MNSDVLLEKVSQITNLAQTIVESHDWPALHVWVLWYPGIDTDLLTDEISQTLAALIEQHLASLPADGCVLGSDELRSSPLRSFASSVAIRCLPSPPSQWAAGIFVPSVRLPPPSADISLPAHAISTLELSSAEIVNDREMKQMVMVGRISTFLPLAQLNALNKRIVALRLSGQNRIDAVDLLTIVGEFVPGERREQVQAVLAAMQEDMEHLSREAFIEKWGIGDDAE